LQGVDGTDRENCKRTVHLFGVAAASVSYQSSDHFLALVPTFGMEFYSRNELTNDPSTTVETITVCVNGYCSDSNRSSEGTIADHEREKE
jgi:hypothetical protein